MARRIDDLAWTDVCAGAFSFDLFCIAIYIGAIQHVDNRVHDDLLQIHSCCCFLAMVQPEFQRTCQLH